MASQNPKITVSPETKSLLDSRKKHEKDTYENVILSLVQPDTPTQTPSFAGAGAGAGDDAYNTISHTLNWISDTKKKLTAGGDYEVTPADRETAFNIDPLISGIICPFLKNTILGNYNIQTADNKKFSECIEEIKEFIKELRLMEIFREDFEDYAIKHGHSYRRKDYFTEYNSEYAGGLKKLQRLESKAMTMYEDPWDSDIVAYHQRIYVRDIWSSTQDKTMTESNSWFIPGGITWVQDSGIEPEGAADVWEQFRSKYNINETSGLRVGSTDDIIAMHKVRAGAPAPMDAAILAVWLKRLVLANGPNYIFSVIMPFLHLKKGVMLKVSDGQGGERLITSVPPAAPADLATTDPERYARMNADRTAYTTALKDDTKNLLRYRAEGGVFASSPDNELIPVESGRNIQGAFIQTIINLLDEDIARAFGFPLALITASGVELATSRTILELFNAAYAGSRQDYEAVANALIQERFDGESWSYEVSLKDGTMESGTYTFEEAKAQFTLSTGDVKDALKEAQVRYTDMQTLQIAKGLGASKPDIQALGDEYGFGLLDLDRIDQAPPGIEGMGFPGMFGGTQSTAKQDIKPENIPKREDEKLKDELLEMYQEAKRSIVNLFGE